MNRKLSKYFSLVFVFIGAFFLLLALLSLRGDTSEMLGGMAMAVFFGIPFMAAGIWRYRRMARLMHQDYAWYRGTHSGAVDENGRVACHSCHGRFIQVRNLMQQTYTREHFCGNCGTTLYYSAEG